jgi:hypothetical protein
MGKLNFSQKIISASLGVKPITFYKVKKNSIGYVLSDVFNVQNFSSGADTIVIYINGNINSTPIIALAADPEWVNPSTEQNIDNTPLPVGAVILINSSSNKSYSGIELVNYYQGQTSIKKQNLSALKGAGFYPESETIYIFKSATTNTLANIFNYAQFEPYIDSLQIYTQGNLGGFYISFFTDGSSFVYDDYVTNANNYIIPTNALLIFYTSANLNITVSGGAIIQKYYSGKISLYKFAPNDLEGLLAWLDASKGIVTGGQPQFVSQIVITASSTSSVNGTYTRTSGGHTQFDKSGGGTPITWNNILGVWVIGALYYSVYLNYWYDQPNLGDNFEAAITYSNLPNIGVSTWTGQSSSGEITLYNYSYKPGFTITLPPQYISSAINSKPAIRFSGSAFYDQNSMFGGLGVSLNDESSVFIVMSSADIYSGTIFSTGTEAFYIVKNGSNLIVGSELIDNFVVNIGLQTNTKTLITCVNNQRNFTIYSNGVSYGTTFFDNFPSAGGSIILGSNSNQNDTASGFVGDIAEVLVYNRPLTDSERKKVETYLNEKYSIY